MADKEDDQKLDDPTNTSTAGDEPASIETDLPDPTNVETRGAESLPFEHRKK